MKTAVIIGGGITGLCAAYELDKAARQGLDLQITLIEAEPVLGGKIRSVKEGSYIMEAGADSIVSRKVADSPLFTEVQIEEDMVYNASGTSYIHSQDGLKQIPADAVFGIPAGLKPLAESELVSAEGKVEALKDYYTPNETFTKEDSVGRFLECFLGKELVEKQIAPVLSGVYSGKLEDLTIASTLPYLLDYKNEYGSLMKGLEENLSKFQKSGDKKFLSFDKGLAELAEKMEAALVNTEIRKGSSAKAVVKDDGGYRVVLEGQEEMAADFVVISTPHTAARELLRDEELNQDFDLLKSSSLISIYLGFDIPDSELPADGTGFITTESSSLHCDACTWTSRKWTHTSRDGKLLLRLFYKSSNPVYSELQNLNEEELIQTALGDVKEALGMTAEPAVSLVTKWEDTMPNYHLQHHQLVESLENKLAASWPGVYLAGCSYYGVGIPDCMENGVKTARSIIEAVQ